MERPPPEGTMGSVSLPLANTNLSWAPSRPGSSLPPPAKGRWSGWLRFSHLYQRQVIPSMLQEAAVQTFRLKPLHTPSFWLCFSKQALLPPASPPAARVGCEFLWVRGSRLICSRQPPWSLGNAAGSPWVFHQHPLEDEGSVEQGRSVCRAGVPGERGIPIRAGQPAASECWMGARQPMLGRDALSFKSSGGAFPRV